MGNHDASMGHSLNMTAPHTSTNRLSGNSAGVKSGVELRFSARWLALERILKGTLGVAVVVCPRLLPDHVSNSAAISTANLTANSTTNSTATVFASDNSNPDLYRAAAFVGWGLLINWLHLFFLRRWNGWLKMGCHSSPWPCWPFPERLYACPVPEHSLSAATGMVLAALLPFN